MPFICIEEELQQITTNNTFISMRENAHYVLLNKILVIKLIY